MVGKRFGPASRGDVCVSVVIAELSFLHTGSAVCDYNDHCLSYFLVRTVLMVAMVAIRLSYVNGTKDPRRERSALPSGLG